jgi:AcrR family transcriptional regulator
MKGHDLIVILWLCKKGADCTYLQMGRELGISASQAFESVETAFELGLLGQDRRTVDVSRFLSLLSYSLPYLFPTKMGGNTRGMPMAFQSIQDESIAHPSSLAGVVLVWPFEEGLLATGVGIEPFSKQAPVLAQGDEKWLKLFSCIEILRFHNHPLRKWVVDWLEVELGIQKNKPIFSDEYHSTLKITPSQVEQALAVGIVQISQKGFCSLELEEVARQIGVSESSLRAHFKDKESFCLAVVRYSMQKAGNFLGRLMVLSEHLEKADFSIVISEFMTFLESNESYFRILMWVYLESNLEYLQVVHGPFSDIILQMEKMIATVTQTEFMPHSPLRGYLYMSIPQWYGTFLWAEGKRFKDQSVVPGLQLRLKNFISYEMMALIFGLSNSPPKSIETAHSNF